MSLLVNWELLTVHHAELFRNILQEYIDNSVQLPEQFHFLRVDDMSFGSCGPDIEIVDLTDPMPHFYPHDSRESDGGPYASFKSRNVENVETSSSEKQYGGHEKAHTRSSAGQDAPVVTMSDQSSLASGSGSSSALSDLHIPSSVPLATDPLLFLPSPSSDPLDTQLTVSLEYTGDMSINMSTELSLFNKPVQGFLSLPVKFRVCSMRMKCLLSVCYLHSSRKVMVTILNSPPPKDQRYSYSSASSSPSKQTMTAGSGYPDNGSFEFDLKTEWEVGDQDRQPVLKNAGKIERFLNDVIVKLLSEKMCFPNFISMNLHDDAGDGFHDGDDARGID